MAQKMADLSATSSVFTEGHPSSRKSFASEFIVRYQDASLQSLDCHEVRTVLFSFASLEILAGNLIALILDVGISIH